MRRRTAVLEVLLATVFVTGSAVAGEVACPPGDNAVIQACIDAAQPGDVIVFSGEYTIDPDEPYVTIDNRGDLTLAGDAAAPPVFRCRIQDNGRPFKVIDFNDALVVRSNERRVSNLTFEDLRFVGCGSAINLAAKGDGSFTHVEMRQLSMSNVYFGVLATGAVQDLTIVDSTIVDADQGIYVSDDRSGRASGIDILGNEVIGLSADLVDVQQQAGIFLEGADGHIRDNRVSNFLRTFQDEDRSIPGIGIVTLNFNPITTVSISRNVVQDNAVGISLGGTATPLGRVADNCVTQSTQFGIVLRSGANAWKVGLNDLEDNPTDVRLTSDADPPAGMRAHDNFIRLLCGQTYSDGGTDNQIHFEHE